MPAGAQGSQLAIWYEAGHREKSNSAACNMCRADRTRVCQQITQKHICCNANPLNKNSPQKSSISWVSLTPPIMLEAAAVSCHMLAGWQGVVVKLYEACCACDLHVKVQRCTSQNNQTAGARMCVAWLTRTQHTPAPNLQPLCRHEVLCESPYECSYARDIGMR